MASRCDRPLPRTPLSHAVFEWIRHPAGDRWWDWAELGGRLDVVRASYRSGGARRELLQRDRVYPLRFKNLMTGNTFRKGHRLRLVVCGSFFPHFSRNLQTGELETVSAHSRPARVFVHYGPPYSSRLVLPVVDP